LRFLRVEDWITKDCDSRYWIGEVRLSSRNQIKEKREQRQCRWVSVRGSHRTVSRHIEFSIQDFHTCTQVLVETVAYIRGFAEAKSRKPQKACNSGSYSRLDFAKFVYNCISLSGPLSLLWEP
jgi:hypothetical protein